MKALGPFEYEFWNYGAILLLDEYFYIVKLNKKASIKFGVSTQLPIFSDPVENLSTSNLDSFLQEHEYVKLDYSCDCKVKIKYSMWKNSIHVEVASKSYKFQIMNRYKSQQYEKWLNESFKKKFSVEGTYSD
jgi:hypothetical protein